MALRLIHAWWFGVALVVIIVPWYFVAQTLSHQHPVKVSSRPKSVVWAGLVFSSQAPLNQWLRSRGASHRHWLATHPAGAAILAHKPPPKPAQPAKAETHAVAAARTTNSNSGGATARDRLLEIAGILLACLTTALAAFAAAPKRLLAVVHEEWETVGVDTRIAAFAAALSIAVGALVTHLGG